MSEDDASQTEEESEAPLDASFKVDSSALGDEETSFAQALGFGSEDPPSPSDTKPAETETVDAAAEASPVEPDAGDATPSDSESEDEDGAEDDVPATNAEEPEPASAEVEDDEESVAAAASGAAADDDRDDEDEAENDADGDWEPIAPRPAAEGMQDALQAHADEVLARPDDGTPFGAARPSADVAYDAGDGDERLTALETELTQQSTELAASRARVGELERALDEAEAIAAQAGDAGDDSAEHEKALEALQSEIDEAILERDQLIDQLAANSGQLVQAQARGEQLEASLRAARGALVPLPEGERALRAEVIGLRGRLEEAGQENVRLAGEVSSVATELAIAAARVEDRQHEIDFHAERAAAFEADNLEKDRQLTEAVHRHREALELATRLQAESTELRSTQAALEETLQARDLEITAREDHLNVTREGLAARDEQIVDLREQLGQENHRIEALEAELERGQIERGVLAHKIERRESRIATLTRTLSRIEDAMGQRITPLEPEGPPLARAEWTQLGGASVVTPLAAPAPPPASASASAPTTMPSARVAESPAPPPVSPDPLPSPAPTVDYAFGGDPDIAEATEPVPKEPLATPVASPSAPQTVETRAADATPAPESEPGLDDASDDAAPQSALMPPPPLPTILSRWRDRQVRDLDDALDGVGALLAEQLLARLYDPPPEAIYLRSLGGSLPDAEVRWVQALQARGLEGIRMEVLDASETNAAARLQHIERAGLGDVIQVAVGSLETWNDEAPCHGILLADVLHAQADVTAVLERLRTQTARGALIFFVGRVGAGPVQLSASTLMRLEELWQLLPDALAEAEGLGRPPYRGDDGGSPAPAEDASDILRREFAPLALVGFGHLSDLVVGPARGFALSDDDADALRLLDAVGAIDASRTETESLPPRHGIGIFGHDSADVAEVFGRPWADAPRN